MISMILELLYLKLVIFYQNQKRKLNINEDDLWNNRTNEYFRKHFRKITCRFQKTILRFE